MTTEKNAASARTPGGRILITLGLLCIAAALALCTFNMHQSRQAADASAQALLQMPATQTSEDQPATFDASTPMPTVEIDGRLYVGTLTIPSLGLELPVLSEWSYEGLEVAPCRYSGSAYAGTLVICGHNYLSHFAALDNLGYGQEVLFTDVLGNCFRYETASVETLEPTAVKDMTASDYELSLFTCNFSGLARTTVRCSEVM